MFRSKQERQRLALAEEPQSIKESIRDVFITKIPSVKLDPY